MGPRGKWLVATRAGVATINSTAGGGLAALIYTKWKSRGKWLGQGDRLDLQGPSRIHSMAWS